MVHCFVVLWLNLILGCDSVGRRVLYNSSLMRLIVATTNP